jgi:hypothetical protein
MSPETAGTQRADRDGVSVTRLHANTEGSPARDVLLGRDQGSLEAQRAGASKRRAAAHLPGKTKAVTQ